MRGCTVHPSPFNTLGASCPYGDMFYSALRGRSKNRSTALLPFSVSCQLPTIPMHLLQNVWVFKGPPKYTSSPYLGSEPAKKHNERIRSKGDIGECGIDLPQGKKASCWWAPELGRLIHTAVLHWGSQKSQGLSCITIFCLMKGSCLCVLKNSGFLARLSL